MILQGVAGAGVMMMQLTSLPQSIAESCRELTPHGHGFQATLAVVVQLLLSLAILAAAALSLAHAAGVDRRRERLAPGMDHPADHPLCDTDHSDIWGDDCCGVQWRPRAWFAALLLCITVVFLMGPLAILFVRGLNQTVVLAVQARSIRPEVSAMVVSEVARRSNT